MKRFYKSVSIGDDNSILLDNRPVKTPAGTRLALPSQALSEAIAEEWRAQGDAIVPASMPLTRMANTTIDGVGANREAIIADLVRYGGADHLCYRAHEPLLAQRHVAAWDPLLQWAADTYGAKLTVVTGIVHTPQRPEALAALERGVGVYDNWALTGLQPLTTITGSLVLSLAVAAGRLAPSQAFALSRIDEDFQAEKWGEDSEAKQRTDNLARDIEIAGKFIALART